MENKNLDVKERRRETGPIEPSEMHPGDIVSYNRYPSEDNPNPRFYDLIVECVYAGKSGMEFTIVGLEDGIIETVTYYNNEEYRLE